MEKHLATLKTKLEKNQAVLFDVREQEEWDEGYLKDAFFVPLSQLNLGNIPANTEKTKDQEIYLYCRSGQRVYIAQPILEDMGFKKVTPLDEGFEELRDEGFAAVEP
ncbi:hypothetical protein COTS27_00925 [Spirochaetota bacterium]|nr:hypothetical protein COTS27_00925 [Spirochaetota bacterium]